MTTPASLTVLPTTSNIFLVISPRTVTSTLTPRKSRRKVEAKATGNYCVHCFFNAFFSSDVFLLLSKFHRGTPGDESQDYGYKFTNARRRSNSSSHGHSLIDFKTKFEAIEADPVFEENYHGAKADVDDEQHMSSLEKGDSADSISTASVEEEEVAKK